MCACCRGRTHGPSEKSSVERAQARVQPTPARSPCCWRDGLLRRFWKCPLVHIPASTFLYHVAFCATQEETFLPCSRRPEVPPAPGVMLFTAGANICVLNG